MLESNNRKISHKSYINDIRVFSRNEYWLKYMFTTCVYKCILVYQHGRIIGMITLCWTFGKVRSCQVYIVQLLYYPSCLETTFRKIYSRNPMCLCAHDISSHSLVRVNIVWIFLHSRCLNRSVKFANSTTILLLTIGYYFLVTLVKK